MKGKWLWVIMISAMISLFGMGCGRKTPERKNQPVEKSVIWTSQHQTDASKEEEKLIWSGSTNGLEPMDCTVEMLQIRNLPKHMEELVNAELRNYSEEAWKRYQICLEQGFETCKELKTDWYDIWAYPMTDGPYLNAVYMIRERQYFRSGVEETRNRAVSIVYDCEHESMITLEEALLMADISREVMEADIKDYISEAEIGKCEGIDSVAFRMLEDGSPQFLAGVSLCRPQELLYAISFFTWTDGVVEWTEDHPVFLYEVDMEQDGMACQRGMGQYEDSN